MKKTFLAAAFVAAFTFSACSENKTADTEATAENSAAAQEEMATPATVVVETPDYTTVAEPVQTQIKQLVDEYLNLKEALVSADAEAAKKAANSVLTLANAMPVATLTGDEKAYAEEKTAQVKESASAIANASDIDAQRASLDKLSESVFSMAKAFGATNQELYYQHCPMANNNEGAYWISTTQEIRNPYFGDKMLKCGSTQETYKN
ncbi:DUF3347 domain-containing protein [Pontibacter sp. E15-1]|uniref:DUF3347 domain-containing protein n=1 Tax=Pontibacter sp. E15-1 TaxID=2919918 RepID=UPI001F4FC5EC|nr:DUF3347 domain-containing protein [Pontibacter sp. E15-1]MCJ8166755.1 DUF3347 domain-containing protein [Pontibacter sp. E15-1]